MELTVERTLHVKTTRYEWEEVRAKIVASAEEVADMTDDDGNPLPTEEALTRLRESLDAHLDADIGRLQEIAPSESFIHLL